MKNLLQISFLFLAIVIGSMSIGSAAHLTDKMLVSAKLTGAQQNPPVVTTAVGVGSFTLNSTRDTLCLNVSAVGLSGPITGAHIHEAPEGINGPVVTPLTSYVNGNRIVATLTGANLTPTMVAKYLSKAYYINIHTAANQGGEIRGQLKLESDFGFRAKLDAAQETHVVVSSALGMGTFNLDHSKTSLQVRVVADGLSGAITGAHFHYGATGVAGPVAIALTSLVSGSTIVGTVDVTAPAGFVDSLMKGSVYINLHTAANAAGEIRGQVMLDQSISLDAFMDAAQESPAPTNPNGKGVGFVSLSPSMDMLTYCIQVTGLSGAITGAHFHDGAVGVNGPVLISLAAGISGNRVTGTITGAALTTATINKFFSGGIYLNVHTAANPAGEIRGQVYRNYREAYTFSLGGSQEVPPLIVNGTGAGLVSIDRDQSNAHFMTVVSGLTAGVTGAHFHNAPQGSNGPVIFSLAPYLTSVGTGASVFGYWKSTNVNPFMTSSSVLFRSNMVYTNFHTSNNPGGEIRGQVLRGSTCFEQPCLAPATNFSSNITGTAVKLNWTSVPDAIGYEITGGTIGNISAVTLSVGAVTSFNVANLKTGQAYVWRIRTKCADGSFSAFSRVDTFTTLSCVAPNPVSTTNITSSSATLNWTVVPNASGYRITGGVVGGSNVVLNVNNGAQSSFQVNNLPSNTSFNWAIQAFCPTVGFSSYSTVALFATLGSPAKASGLNDYVGGTTKLVTFPNPATNELNVILPELTTENAQITLTDMSGRTVKLYGNNVSTGATVQLSLEGIENGVYQLSVLDGSKIHHQRVMIMK